MITLRFTDGTEIKTRCRKPASAINKAINENPLKGSIDGTAMIRNGRVFGIINGCSWISSN